MALLSTAYTSGHFELSLDGAKACSYLKSVDGGFMTHSLVEEAIGGTGMRIKHSAVADIEPISFEVGMAGAAPVLRWINASWENNYATRNGQINHANFNMRTVFEHEFSDAHITETTFPTLDGSSKEPAYLKVKLQPTSVSIRKLPIGGAPVLPITGLKQKLWQCSAFCLNIDGIPGTQFANKIESFTIKQNVKKAFFGNLRGVELTPTKIEFPSITGTIALDKADGFLDWYNSYIAKGMRDPNAQRSGSIEFLAPNRMAPLFQIKLHEVGLLKASIQASQANADQIKRLKFELYVGSMSLDRVSLGLDGF